MHFIRRVILSILLTYTSGCYKTPIAGIQFSGKLQLTPDSSGSVYYSAKVLMTM